MYAFAINIVDSSIDAKICSKHQSTPAEGKCKAGSNSSGETNKKLSEAYPASSTTEKVDAVTSKTIATETVV